MKTYPIMLDVSGRRAAVVGGGRVGLRRARSLRRAGADVRLITLAADAADEAEGITILEEPYRSELLEGCSLVFACTDDHELNARVACDARSIGALVNVADEPDKCDFFVPATICRGNVVVAIGTGGSVPALAGDLKEQIDQALPDRLDEFADALAEIRQGLKTGCPDDERRKIMRQLAGRQSYQVFVLGGADALREKLKQLTGGRE